MTIRKLSCHLVALAILGVAGAQAQMPGHGPHPPMPNQRFFFHYQTGAGGDAIPVSVPLEMPSPTAPAELDQVVTLPEPWGPVRLKRYLPRAALEQDVVPDSDPGAPPAILCAIEGATQSYQRWLVADDVQRNQLVSLIGTWRYMSVSDKRERAELYRQFENELTRDPKLIVSRADGGDPVELEVRDGAAHELKPLGCRVTTQVFYPHFRFDQEAGKPTNKSDKRLNPAVLVRIDMDGRTEERWVFAKHPEFRASEADALPYRVVLDCPLDTDRTAPDFVLVTIGRTTHEVWSRHQGRVTVKRAAVGEKIDVPGSRYTFNIARFVPAGRLVEEYGATEGRGAAPALQIEMRTDAGGRASSWLPLGDRRYFKAGADQLVVWFGPEAIVAPAGHGTTP